MRIVEVLLVEGRNPLSWIIKWGTNSKYSHCAVRIDDFVYESSLGGVQTHTWEDYYRLHKLDRKRLFHPIHGLPSDAVVDEIEKWCWRAIAHGRHYNYWHLLGVATKILFGWVWLDAILSCRDAFVCYEFVLFVLAKGGFYCPVDRDNGAPQDLLLADFLLDPSVVTSIEGKV